MSDFIIRMMVISWTTVFVLGIPLIVWQILFMRKIQLRINNEVSNRKQSSAFSLSVDLFLVQNNAVFKSLSADEQRSCKRWRILFFCYSTALIIGFVTYYAYTFRH
jgi:hypothetical protein